MGGARSRLARVAGDLVTVETMIAGTVELDEDAPACAVGETLLVGLRPEKIVLGHDEPVQALNKVKGEIWDIGYLGDMTMVQVMVGGALVFLAGILIGSS